MSWLHSTRNIFARMCHPGYFLIFLFILISSSQAQEILHDHFDHELLFEVPDIEHPTVVTCDDQGNLFIGEDPMDMRGPSTEEFDRIQYVVFDSEGKPIRKTIFAENLSAVFGMVWHDGALYVMHAPHYTMFKDTDGDGVADVRKELADGFGPPPGQYGFNDHIVTGTRLGMDGFVYVSVGDKGIPSATGSDGSTISLEGGGVVRMRLDGTELENFSSGTRNHLDVAMDSLDNIFTYDNTDDGLGWWTRFTHHIPTGYYGYPYDYHPHPERHLPHISEYGGGSPVGAACYRGAAWPKRYWDADFHCEWGKRKIQVFFPEKKGATFDATMEDFMIPTEGDEFRPQDNCFSPDGKYMYVADWQYGGWTNPKVTGRVFRVSYTGDHLPEPPRVSNDAPMEIQIESLGHPAHHERMRAQWELARRGPEVGPLIQVALHDDSSSPAKKIHALWALAERFRRGDTHHDPTGDFIAALGDSNPDVRAQSARALGTLRIKEGTQILIRRLKDPDPTVRLHAAVALGRIGDNAAAEPLFEALDEEDDFARFAMIQALRAIDYWEPAVDLIHGSVSSPTHAALVALVGEYHIGAVESLSTIARQHPNPMVRAESVSIISEVHRKADPYSGGWWGTRPAGGKPSRAKKHDWEGTEKVLETIHLAINDASANVRIASLAGQEEVGESIDAEFLHNLLVEDPAEEVRIEVLRRLVDMKDSEAIDLIAGIATSVTEGVPLRSAAVRSLAAIDPKGSVESLQNLVAVTNTPVEVMVAAIEGLSLATDPEVSSLVKERLHHSSPFVRAAAVNTLGDIAGRGAWISIVPLLDDEDTDVQKAVVRTLTGIGAKESIPHLIRVADRFKIRHEVIEALHAMPDPSALSIYLNGIAGKNQSIRELCGEAMLEIKEKVLPDLIERYERNELSPETRRKLGDLFAAPLPISEWNILAAWSKDTESVDLDVTQTAELHETFKLEERTLEWRQYRGDLEYGRIIADKLFKPLNHVWLMAYTTIEVEQPYEAHWMIGCDDQAILWINGEKVFQDLEDGSWGVDDGEGKTHLKKGTNTVWLQSGNAGGNWVFSLAVSEYDPRLDFLYEDVPEEIDLESFRDYALNHKGDPNRGEALFKDLNGIGCIKCHAVADEGDAIVGPNLIGIGSKYQKEELIRSVLEPSNRIESGYELTLIETFDDEFIDGIVRSENETEIELINADGEILKVDKDNIQDRRKSTLSTMPNGLEKGMTLQDLSDIVAYLENQKETSAGSE